MKIPTRALYASRLEIKFNYACFQKINEDKSLRFSKERQTAFCDPWGSAPILLVKVDKGFSTMNERDSRRGPTLLCFLALSIFLGNCQKASSHRPTDAAAIMEINEQAVYRISLMKRAKCCSGIMFMFDPSECHWKVVKIHFQNSICDSEAGRKHQMKSAILVR